MNRAAVVIIGCGNPSRGDDALGPCLMERLDTVRQHDASHHGPELITDFQLQIEHVIDLEDRTLSLFIDASVSAQPPFQFSRLIPQQDHSYSSHSLSPATLLSIFDTVYKTAPPPAYLLSIPGYQFELGWPLSEKAEGHLELAFHFIGELLRHPNQAFWDAQVIELGAGDRPPQSHGGIIRPC